VGNGKGKSVLITGCSSGIGLALAHGLHARGYQVFASARRAEDVERLGQAGLAALELDLDDSMSIRNAVREVLARTGGTLYGLVNNGAYGQPGAVEDLTREAMRAQFETNVFGTLELTNLCLPVMRKAGTGRLIQVSSLLGYVCMTYRGAYNASKHALEALTDTLRLELRGSGIHAVLVEPGPIRSRFRANSLAALEARIDTAASPRRETYDRVRARLASTRDAPFTLPPEAVLPAVVHALEHPRPHRRYQVTVPARVAAWLKRLLPAAWMDPILVAASGVPGGGDSG